MRLKLMVGVKGYEDRNRLVSEPPPAVQETVYDPRFYAASFVPPTAPHDSQEQRSYLSSTFCLFCVSDVRSTNTSLLSLVSSTV